MKNMTTQDRVYHAIEEWHTTHGYSPSLRDIGNMVGIQSTGNVHYHLVNLEANGRIKREKGLNRSITLTSDKVEISHDLYLAIWNILDKYHSIDPDIELVQAMLYESKYGIQDE